jgi:hypothetical protein
MLKPNSSKMAKVAKIARHGVGNLTKFRRSVLYINV